MTFDTMSYWFLKPSSPEDNRNPLHELIFILTLCAIGLLSCMLLGCRSSYERVYEQSSRNYMQQLTVDSMQRRIDSLTHIIVVRDSMLRQSDIKDSVLEWKWQSDSTVHRDSVRIEHMADGSTRTDHYHETTRLITIQEKNSNSHIENTYEQHIRSLEDSVSFYKAEVDALVQLYTELTEDTTYHSHVKEIACTHPWYINMVLWFYRMFSAIGLFFMILYLHDHWDFIIDYISRRRSR